MSEKIKERPFSNPELEAQYQLVLSMIRKHKINLSKL